MGLDVILLAAVLAWLGVFLWAVLRPSGGAKKRKEGREFPPVGPPPAVPPAATPEAPPAAPPEYVTLYQFTPRPVGWRCPVCDGENGAEAPQCQVCGQTRPVYPGSF